MERRTVPEMMAFIVLLGFKSISASIEQELCRNQTGRRKPLKALNLLFWQHELIG
jgi:hypothetical protein